MKTILTSLRKVMITTISIIAFIGIVSVFLVNCSPQFGGKITRQQKLEFAKSDNYEDGKFVNSNNAKVNMSAGNLFKMIKAYIKPNPNTIPETNIEVEKVDSLTLTKTNYSNLIWFGHSTFLLQLDELNILIDPMFGEVPAPYPFLGNKRFSEELPIEIQKLPKIDAVLLSHDHYDHLDYESIKKLKGKVERFYVPLGVGAHLRKWGIDENRIEELNWWNTSQLNHINIVCTPAQHFSGRGLTDGGSTLWSSWVIQSDSTNIFFSGDTGYGSHFKAIGDKYGPFDMALMECGQYNELWSEIHMMPEETVQAAKDVNANKMIPIHWGAFKLALHDWRDPIRRVTQRADQLKVDVISPKIGEMVDIHQVQPVENTWWKQVE